MNIFLFLFEVIKFLFIALFAILKILLIIFLILLIVIILILIIIFITPINYRIIVNTDNLFENPKNIYSEVKINWFLKCIKFDFRYFNEKPSYKIIIMGKSREQWAEMFKWTKKFKRNKKNTYIEKELHNDAVIKDEQSIIEQTITESDYKEITEPFAKTVIQDTNNKNTRQKTKKIKKQKKQKTKKDKSESILNKIKYFYNYPNKGIIIKSFIKNLKQIIYNLKPTVFKLNGEVGFEDLALTGQIVGISAALAGMMQKEIFIQGNFAKKTIVIKLYAKGKIIIWSIIFPILKFIFTKPVLKIIYNAIFGKKKKEKQERKLKKELA